MFCWGLGFPTHARSACGGCQSAAAGNMFVGSTPGRVKT
jgi:hypothetical protein